MSFRVANDDDGLESSALTGTSLFLDWLDLQGRNGQIAVFCNEIKCRVE